MSWQTYIDEQLNVRRNTPLWRKAQSDQTSGWAFF